MVIWWVLVCVIHSDSFGCVYLPDRSTGPKFLHGRGTKSKVSRLDSPWIGGSFQWETTGGLTWLLRISGFLFRGASKVLGCEKVQLFKSPGEPAGESVGKNDSRMQIDLLLNSHGTMASAPQMARTDPTGRLPKSPWVFPRHTLLIPKISTRMLDDYLAMGHNWIPRLLDGYPLVI